MQGFSDLVSSVNDFVWGPALIILLVGTGIFLTFRLKFRPWKNLGFALKHVFKGRKHTTGGEGDITPFQSLMTALSATIGTGNIAGVATAMVLGGPGALVWMWISALFGLTTKYAECMLAVKYREKNSRGEMAGGPMYVMQNGFKHKGFGRFLGMLFAIFAVLASFGIGNMTQVDAIASALNTTFGVEYWIVGIALVVLTAIVIIGGIQSIGKVSSIIVPVMAIVYVIGGLVVIIGNIGNLGTGIVQIITNAFGKEMLTNMTGGFAGMMVAMRFGVARGLFSNEAGLGSAPIAAAAGKTDYACRQGYISMTGTFFDTIIVCTITGLAIACSGVLGITDANGEFISGVNLTIHAFSTIFGDFGGIVISVGITLFAYSTILGWSYYGEKSFEYITGTPKLNIIYRLVFCAVVFLGSLSGLQVAWNISEIFNGLMAIPNLICLIVMSNIIAKETKSFEDVIKREKRLKRA